ncbi:hypothetical protein E2C01_086308 [Portunus trituberculatus]|uniref:Uncharacterized protein n=1 Tax=Portunus trituberculatus TaxID=210409 RepID=A0A5B7JG04_PORTR|nr:hypothetical protein [Portunus trituberculatus]
MRESVWKSPSCKEFESLMWKILKQAGCFGGSSDRLTLQHHITNSRNTTEPAYQVCGL